MLNAIATVWREPAEDEETTDAAPSGKPFVILCLSFARDADPEKLAELKRALRQSPAVLSVVEATGAFDMVLEVGASDPATCYRWLLAITGPYGGILTREEVCFGSRPLAEAEETPIWVPHREGMLALRMSAIVKLTAEGDYVRVHAEGRSWLVHATLQSYEFLLRDGRFLQVHRSTIVRAAAVERIERAAGRWSVALCDGSSERVARNRASAVKQLLYDRSTSRAGHSPMAIRRASGIHR